MPSMLPSLLPQIIIFISLGLRVVSMDGNITEVILPPNLLADLIQAVNLVRELNLCGVGILIFGPAHALGRVCS